MNLYYVDDFIHPYTDHVNNLHGKTGAPCGTCRRCRMCAAVMEQRQDTHVDKYNAAVNCRINYRLQEPSMNMSHQL